MTKHDQSSTIVCRGNGGRISIVLFIVMHILCIQLVSIGSSLIFVCNSNNYNNNVVDAFLIQLKVKPTLTSSSKFILLLQQQQDHHDLRCESSIMNRDHKTDNTRRTALFVPMSIAVAGLTHKSKTAAATSLTTTLLSDATITTTNTPLESVTMKTFIDPQGLFVMNIPQRYFAIRRTNQGDLPSTSTGSGRRGSSIFNAGDLSKAEVVAVERYVNDI
jgi:hypothetical protein